MQPEAPSAAARRPGSSDTASCSGRGPEGVQCYELQAIDRPFTAKEMSELRSYSRRASITSRSFVNEVLGVHRAPDFPDEKAWLDLDASMTPRD